MRNRLSPLGLVISLIAATAFTAAPHARAQVAASPSASSPSTGMPRNSTTTAAAGTSPTPTNVMTNIQRAETAGDANSLVLAYGEAVRDPQLARGALSQLLTDYFRLRSLATSAMQASQAVDEAALRFAIFQAAQNQVNVQQNQQLLANQQRLVEQNQKIIDQNERMIALLDLIARKR